MQEEYDERIKIAEEIRQTQDFAQWYVILDGRLRISCICLLWRYIVVYSRSFTAGRIFNYNMLYYFY